MILPVSRSWTSARRTACSQEASASPVKPDVREQCLGVLDGRHEPRTVLSAADVCRGYTN